MTIFQRRVVSISAEHPVARGERAEAKLEGLPFEIGDQHFKPERLFISRGTDWDLSSLVVDDRELLDQELPGRLFAVDSSASGRWIDTLRKDSTIRASAIYRGTSADADAAGSFIAALIGVDVSPSPHGPRALSGSIRFRDVAGEPIAVACDGPERVLPGQSAWFVARADTTVKVEHIVLDLACEEWTIDDIAVGNGSKRKSQLMGGGSLPGEIFAPNAIDTFITLPPVLAGVDFAFKVTYRGSNPRGRFFGATCVCRLVHQQ